MSKIIFIILDLEFFSSADKNTTLEVFERAPDLRVFISFSDITENRSFSSRIDMMEKCV